jgi:hypothetical protein
VLTSGAGLATSLLVPLTTAWLASFSSATRGVAAEGVLMPARGVGSKADNAEMFGCENTGPVAVEPNAESRDGC